MSSTMALRCLLRRIPSRQLLPRVGRGVPAAPPASRPMSTLYEDEAFEADTKRLNTLRESMKVRREASIKEGIEMERKCMERMEGADRSLDGYTRAIDNVRKVKEARAVAVSCLAGFCLLLALGMELAFPISS
ncbi:unnamed protein product [Urochloa humidicola]